MRRLIFTFLLLVSSFTLFYGQSEADKRQARKIGSDAMALIRVKSYEKSHKMLLICSKLDPDNFLYPYEIGYIYMLQKKYNQAIEYFEKAAEKDSVSDLCFQMLGNSYYLAGKRDLSKDAYARGLEKFPSSGRLYLGLGNASHDDMIKALSYYEYGVKVDPSYALNYYWLAKIFCNTPERIWGLIYGEIFLNLEQDTRRSDEISSLLYDTYREGIVKNDSITSVNFYRMAFTYKNENVTPTKILPISMIYDPCMKEAVKEVKEINLTSLDVIRSSFIRHYYQENYNISHPCILFEWHKTLMDKGYFDCYNYWLLEKGDPTDFSIWYASNQDRYEAFLKWFSENPLVLGPSRRFHRFAY